MHSLETQYKRTYNRMMKYRKAGDMVKAAELRGKCFELLIKKLNQSNY